MSVAAGTRIGSYEVIDVIGAGGMGEVYRARDTRLHRDVALKILPEVFASDAERLARFEREAHVLASLNHPNIAAIYGLEEGRPEGGPDDGNVGTGFNRPVRALVMELVEGETIADRIARGPMSLDEALPVARQIADVLQAAHEQGIIHRDLKPANIKLRPDGSVKVLDFGLAKALEPAGSIAGAATISPTITSPAMMTGIGMLLGTAAYMSPEQAKGRPADKRSDIWAFGCIVYEMLTGRRAFEGEDVSDTLANVLKSSPEWSALSADVPPRIRALLTSCLQKDRTQRMADIAVAQFLLNDGTQLESFAAAKPPARVERRGMRDVLAWTLCAAALVTVGVVITMWAPWRGASAPRPVRFEIAPPPAVPVVPAGGDVNVAVSPNGERIVYVSSQFGFGVGGGGAQLVLRDVGRLEPVPIRGTIGRYPFFSPDGQWIGFFLNGELKKVSVTGGPSITVCRFSGQPSGATWGPQNTIVFATSDPTTGLFSVPAGGGEPTLLTKPDTARGERDHANPVFIGGRNAVLFRITSSSAETAEVAVLDLANGRSQVLIRGGENASYVEGGYLVYAALGTLRAVRFDVETLQVTSDAVPVVDGVRQLGRGPAEFTISRNGTLAYIVGSGDAVGPRRTLVSVDRHGKEEALDAPPRAYGFVRVSPDGNRLAVDVRAQEADIWIWELRRKTLTRLTFDPASDQAPLWTPDGRRIVFSSSRAGAQSLFWQSADGTGTVARLTTAEQPQWPTAISPDGKQVVLREVGSNSVDLKLLNLADPSRSAKGRDDLGSLVATPFNDEAADISPDGRWVTYYSNESGQNEVYVRPFPNAQEGRWQISTGGGSRPVWAKSGRELFYLGPRTEMMMVPVETSPTFSAGNASKLFDGPWYFGNAGRSFDVSRDGQHFFMIKEGAATDSSAAVSTVNVVVNWQEELKARLAGK